MYHADPNEQLVLAASSGDIEAVLSLLSGADVNAIADSTTALEAAALEGHEGVVQILLAAGAHVAAADANGWNSLHNAVYSGHLEVVRMLLDHRADANALTSDHRTPLHLVADADPKVDFKLTVEGPSGRTSFFAPALVQYLCAAGASVNFPSADGSTPLHAAASVSAGSTVLALCSNGADCNATDSDGRTPLQVVGKVVRPKGPTAAETLDRLREMLRGGRSSASTAHADSHAGSSSGAAPTQAPTEGLAMDVDEDEESLSWSAALDAAKERLWARQRQRSVPQLPRRKREDQVDGADGGDISRRRLS